MINRDMLEKMRGYSDFVKMASEATDSHLNYLVLPHKNREAFDTFLEDEGSKIDFVDEVEKRIFPVEGRLVLDAGCGKGGLIISCALRGAKAFGIDVDEEELKIANLWIKKLDISDSVSIKKGSITDIPFADNFFDLVTCSSVLEHVEDTEEAIKEIARVLKPGGFCCIGGPNSIFPREAHYKIFWPPYLPKKIGALYLKIRGFNPDFFVKDVYYLSVSKLTKTLKNHGFEINNITEKNILFKFRNPQLLKNVKKRKIVKIFKNLKINNYIAKIVVFLKFYSHVFVIAKKKYN